jgi:hypothetical protein
VTRLALLALVILWPQLAVADAPKKTTPKKETTTTAKGTLIERSWFDIQPTGKAFKQITIDNPLGDVRVEGYDGTAIEIETRKHGPSEEALDRLGVTLVPNPDGTVRMKTTADPGDSPIQRSQVRIDLIVRAPRTARIEAASFNGALEVINMDAGGDLDTGSGYIMVRNVAGELSTHSVSGATSLTQVFGSVDAQIMSNDLALDSIGGERLIASVTHGKIEGRRVRSRDVELSTVDGRIAFEGEASLRGRFIVSTVKGDIDIKLRRNGVLVVRGRGSKVNLGGTIRSLQNGWVERQLGQVAANQSPATVELKSRDGTVDFALVEW